MAMYRAAIVGLGGMGIGALPAAPHHTGMGIEWEYDSVAASLSHSSGFAVTPGVEVVAVCDLKEELFAQFLTNYGWKWPDAKFYADFDEMLAKEDIDLLGVVTSDHQHARFVESAAAAGVRGILCEKPMATTVAEMDRMIEACERSRRGHDCRLPSTLPAPLERRTGPSRRRAEPRSGEAHRR